MDDMTTLWSAVGTIIAPIAVPVASEMIIAVNAAAAAQMQLKVRSGFEILENSIGGKGMAAERRGIESAKGSDCKWDIGPSSKYHVHHWANNCLVAFDLCFIFLPWILGQIQLQIRIHWSWYTVSILHIEIFENCGDVKLWAKTDAGVGTILLMVDVDAEQLACRGEIRDLGSILELSSCSSTSIGSVFQVQHWKVVSIQYHQNTSDAYIEVGVSQGLYELERK